MQQNKLVLRIVQCAIMLSSVIIVGAYFITRINSDDQVVGTLVSATDSGTTSGLSSNHMPFAVQSSLKLSSATSSKDIINNDLHAKYVLILQQLTLVDPVLNWGTETPAKEGFPKSQLSGIEVRATSTHGRGGKGYEWTFPYNAKIAELGFAEDTSLDSDGMQGGMAGFRKDGVQLLLIEYIDYFGSDSEGVASCPCTYTYKIFIANH